MKRILSILSVTAFIAVSIMACKNKMIPSANELNNVSYEDTVGFAQFQAWKQMNERVDPMRSYDPAGNSSARSSSSSRSSNSGSMSSSSSHTAKKKGWSKAAKYSVIGGGTGIVLGAVINKRNRVAGGAVGGILGGGLGYVLGRAQDKKEGRY